MGRVWGSRRLRELAAALGAATVFAFSHPSYADDGDLCLDEIAKQEAHYGMPPGLLKAIARVESSGSPYGVITKPWPWTLNVGGVPHYYPTKQEALAALQQFRVESNVNIDVGCMQISLNFHPNAFPDLATALDPISNVDYGALFLSALEQKSGDWMIAAGDYHSTTPGFGDTYRNLVSIALNGGPMPSHEVETVRATLPDGPAIISIASIGGQTVIRRLDLSGQPIAGTETNASGVGESCDHLRRQTSLAAGSGVRVWSGRCADPDAADKTGNRITIPDSGNAQP